MQRKNSDYTGGETATDALANFRTAKLFGVHPAIGLMIRMTDKMMRVKSFVADGTLRVTNESVADACEDLLNYSILLKALLIEAGEEQQELNEEQELESQLGVVDRLLEILNQCGGDEEPPEEDYVSELKLKLPEGFYLWGNYEKFQHFASSAADDAELANSLSDEPVAVARTPDGALWVAVQRGSKIDNYLKWAVAQDDA